MALVKTAHNIGAVRPLVEHKHRLGFLLFGEKCANSTGVMLKMIFLLAKIYIKLCPFSFSAALQSNRHRPAPAHSTTTDAAAKADSTSNSATTPGATAAAYAATTSAFTATSHHPTGWSARYDAKWWSPGDDAERC